MFNKTLLAMAFTMASLASVQAHAALVVDTGAPTGAGFPLTLDGNDWLAGQVSFSQALTINSIKGWLNDGIDGLGSETFTVALYADASNSVGGLLDSTTGQFLTAQGVADWNGAAGLNWSVGPGKYWVAFEVQGSNSFGGEAPISAPAPLARYAFNDGSYLGYHAMSGFPIGIQVDATIAAVPEPATTAMLLAGLSVVAVANRKKKAA